MMKHIIFTGTLLLASAMSGEAMAQCFADPTPYTTGLDTGDEFSCDTNRPYRLQLQTGVGDEWHDYRGPS